MTNTPDKESNTAMDRTAGRLRSTNLGMAGHCISDDSGRLIAVAQTADSAERIVTACNAFERMREALILAEKADRIHSKCQECEDGAQAPEACGDCFPSADDARIARRNVLKSLGVRMRDVERGRMARDRRAALSAPSTEKVRG